MDGEKWTVKEFAEKADITTQRVSQLMRKRLKQFVIEENGQKYILSSALPEVLQARLKQGYRAKSETVSETVSDIPETVSETLVKDLQAELDALRAERDMLRQDLHALEIAAADAAARLDEVRKHEAEQAQTITTLNESLRMALFHAGTLRGQLEQAAQRPDDALAKRDAIISTEGIAKRDAVTVIQTDDANDNGKKPEQQMHEVVKRPPINPDKKKKSGIGILSRLSRLWRHK